MHCAASYVDLRSLSMTRPNGKWGTILLIMMIEPPSGFVVAHIVVTEPGGLGERRINDDTRLFLFLYRSKVGNTGCGLPL